MLIEFSVSDDVYHYADIFINLISVTKFSSGTNEPKIFCIVEGLTNS